MQENSVEIASNNVDENANEDEAENLPLDWTIELVDNLGNRANALLSSDSVLYPLIRGTPYRAEFLDDTKPAEVLFRRFELPVSNFRAQGPEFDASAIAAIRFVFDQTEKGAIILDSISID